METKKIINGNGDLTSNNWMLDEIIKSFQDRGLNSSSNIDLIKELCVQKMKYGQTCMMQLIHKTQGFDELRMSKYHESLHDEIEQKILELKK